MVAGFGRAITAFNVVVIKGIVLNSPDTSYKEGEDVVSSMWSTRYLGKT